MFTVLLSLMLAISSYAKPKVAPKATTRFAISDREPAAAEKTFDSEGHLTLHGKRLQEYYALYSDPYVHVVRRTLDAYFAGKLQGTADAPIFKGIDGHGGLRVLDRSFAKSKFIVIQVVDATGGGKNVSIVFIDKPNRMFDMWVYRTSGGLYDPRGFEEDTSYRPGEIPKIYRNYLEDPVHRL